MTTPISTGIDESVRRLRELWAEAGREGEPYIVVLDGKPDPEKIAMYRDLGVHELVYGTPDRSEEEVLAYLERLAGKLRAASSPSHLASTPRPTRAAPVPSRG